MRFRTPDTNVAALAGFTRDSQGFVGIFDENGTSCLIAAARGEPAGFAVGAEW